MLPVAPNPFLSLVLPCHSSGKEGGDSLSQEGSFLRIKKDIDPGTYIGTAVEILHQTGKIEFSAMGRAILSACDLSRMLEAIGFPQQSVKLETFRSEKDGKKFSTSRLAVIHVKK